MSVPKFGLNRHDTSSVAAYAADVARAETCGWDAAFIPDSQLRRRDTYVLLAAAAQSTCKIDIGTLLVNPVNRHPTVTASSIATIAELAPGRTVLGCGIGDTAVRLAGLKPARIRELEASVMLMKSLLAGDEVDVGAAKPAVLPFPAHVPVWVAAGGPKTLEMAGACADGVFIRVGTHLRNIQISVERIRAGAKRVGRDPRNIRLGAVFHTVFVEDEEVARLMGKSMAAGYYEYSPMLLDHLGLDWKGAHPNEFKSDGRVWPDFHHASDLEASGRCVNFLSEAHARAFCLLGGASAIAEQLADLIQAASEQGIEFEYVVLQPIPDPPRPDPGVGAYIERVPAEIISKVQSRLM